MATESPNQSQVPEVLRKQLALAVRSIQWSYAIFWSISATQPGVLEWSGGYYNGDIKTRKTVQAVELNADQLGLQRSDQLRELYESLSLGETIPQAKRPTAALSPEDLTDAEWYFLVCMSFVFNIGQGLPGKTLAKNQTFWLCNAHRADTKFFTRSLLAKSASIQTIVCFPHLGGVVELGTTEQVPEDPNLIQHVKTSFLECPLAIACEIPDHVPIVEEDLICEVLDHTNIPENGIDHLLDCPDVDISSPNDSSNDFADNLLREESNLAEGIDGEVSQIQSWPFMDDAISNCVNNSVNSSDSVSQTYENPDSTVPISDGNKVNNSMEECNQQKLNSIGVHSDDVHYHSVLSNLLRTSNQLILGPYLRNGSRRSSFVSWKKDRPQRPHTKTPQNLLKKVLFEVARMHERSRLESNKQNGKKDGLSKTEDEVDRNHVLSERKRREKINERFLILGSLVPSGGKVDKVSILNHTIEYLRELERKVEELQSYKDQMERGSTTQNKPNDSMERTSDNYGPIKTDNAKKPSTGKRKACDGPENQRPPRLRESSTDKVTVSISDKDVLIEIKCSWKESVLLEIMDVLKKLNLDSQDVQSANSDGILSLTINAKWKGLKVASSTLIRQALNKVIRKS